ncbi:protein CapI [Arsukibacterium ikkense]|uniref:Protein CapI n=1 Tax=Arsukibacterium ikkense TaxID=336831 RepID=A0A0M2V8S2_9GAMM|nr:NAD-dependent epimerase [Arsukibacterium ikkense]KKO46819.1 protein CapI [Arsukibacterium ikkense]
MKYLVTGAAGFIGMHTAEALLRQGHKVVGIDNLNHYYDPRLKLARLQRLAAYSNFSFVRLDLADRQSVATLFANEQFSRVIHLAAQAGVRYSIENPMAYVDSNLVGMMTILEGCRHNKVAHLVYASSSSVYGNQLKVPFSETDPVDTPVSLYAATKKSNELMAHTYSHLYQLPTTGLRFFTVYGPWGRPDMAPWLFTEAISQNKAINVFNNGNLMRDFTFISDIVEGILRVQDVLPDAVQGVPYKLYNIGNNQPVKLESFISTIEQALGKVAQKHYLPMQDGDVYQTYADVSRLHDITGFAPQTSLADGMRQFTTWYQGYVGAKVA